MTKVFFIFFRRIIILAWIFTVLLPFVSKGELAQGALKTPAGALAKCWSFEESQAAVNKIASDNDKLIFFALDNGEIEARDINSGKIIWKTILGGQIVSQILYDSGKIYIVTVKDKSSDQTKDNQNSAGTTDEFTVRSISVLTGITVWQQNFKNLQSPDEQGRDINMARLDKYLYLISGNGNISVLEAADGSLHQQLNLGADLSSIPVLSNKSIYLGTTKRSLVKLSTETNDLSSSLVLKDAPSSIYITKNSNLIVGDVFGRVTAFDLLTKKLLWTMRTGAQVIDIIQADENILISSNDNYVYSVSENSGDIVWKKRLAGRNAVTLSQDKSLLLSVTLNTDTLTLSSSQSGKTVNQMFLDSDKYFIYHLTLLGHFVIAPTNLGFVVYSLSGCGTKVP